MKKDTKKKISLETEELKNQLARAVADYQNLQKRNERERQDWIRTANKDLILRFLPALDTLMLAGKHVSDQGLALSIQQFLDTLKNEGVEKIETVGKSFDPNVMECIATGEGEEGKVIEEIRVGYTLNDSVLRPAQVRVGKNRPAVHKRILNQVQNDTKN